MLRKQVRWFGNKSPFKFEGGFILFSFIDAVLTIDIEKEEAKKRSTALKNEMNKTKTKYAAMEIDKTYDATATVARSMNSKPQREKSVETISSSGSRSYSRSRSRSYNRSISRSRSLSRSRSRSFSRSRNRSRPHYKSSRRDYDRRSRSPRYYRRSRSRSRSRSHGLNYRRYHTASYRTKSPVYVRPTSRTIRYDRYTVPKVFNQITLSYCS